MLKSKTMAIFIALTLMLTVSFSLVALPIASAHTPAWDIPSYAYLVPAPNPVGVGQKVAIVMWIDEPLPSASVGNDIRRHDYKLTITAPDGTVETKEWPIVDDTTSIQYYQYTPSKVGTYTLLFEYKGQIYTWGSGSSSYNSDHFLPASKTTTLTVQEEALPDPRGSYPLPKEYWTRPIEGQNTDWYAVSSNWLGSPYIPGAGSSYGIPGGIQLEGIAPNSPHIMWSKPIQDGGVVGGNGYHLEGTNYYMGGSYNMRFSNALIMYGRLYYQEPYGNSGSGGAYVCVDLRTGAEHWRINTTGVGVPSFGYLYDYDHYNQHGVIPEGWLFTSNFGRAYDPSTGIPSTLNITNVPSGTAVVGPAGEILRYVWSSSTRNLRQWNSSKVFATQTSGTLNASLTSRFDWDINITGLGSGSWSVNRAAFNNIMLLTQGNLGDRGSWGGENITAVSLKPESRGFVLWTRNYPAAPGNVTRAIVAWDPDAGVFVTQDKETMIMYGWSLASGERLWGPTEPTNDYTFFRQTTMIAYGKVYFAGYGGILYCYDVTNGDLLWTYGNGGTGNSTNSGLGTAWGSYPVFVDVIADGKIFLGTTEHSPNSPYYKDTLYRCVNATTGEEIWTLMGFGTGMDAGCDVVADGFFVFLNCYDMQVYCVGKGPSALTVEAPKASIELGKSLVISGTVTDVAAGTKQNEQAARFPYGVPAVSDDSMKTWMEYVYMQKPRPTDAVGVPVKLSVVDANGNFREIGEATSDINGYYSFPWMPDIPGHFAVFAEFGGSESYWPSRAETSFIVDAAAEPSPTVEARIVLPPTETYIAIAAVGIIVAIAVVGVLVLRAVNKK